MTLKGKKILLTRFEQDNPLLAQGIIEAGGVPISIPVLAIHYRQIQMNLTTYTWLFFTSQHGVHAFFQQHIVPKEIHIAVVGEKTKQAVESYGYEVAFVPHHYTAKAFVQEISSNLTKEDRVLFVKGNLARTIVSSLRKFFQLDEVVVYDTVIDEKGVYQFQAQIHEVDGVVFTSPSAVHAVKEIQIDVPIFVIGPSTKEAVLQLGSRELYMPMVYTIDNLVEEVKRRL